MDHLTAHMEHLPGIRSGFHDTERLRIHALSCGDVQNSPLVFIHGNFSSSVYFEELMLALSNQYFCLAPDLRGYGETEDRPIDATRGAKDWADDLAALREKLQLPPIHLVGWSIGAAAVLAFAQDYAEQVRSVTLISPISPFGFGGTKEAEGLPCHTDYSGSGGGLVAPEFVQRILAQDRSCSSPFSPRNVMRTTFTHSNRPLQREEALLSGSLMQKIGPERYPGDAQPSSNWPKVAPGSFGPLNAVSPKFLNLGELLTLQFKPAIHWIRGDKDCIISDQSQSDLAVLGQLNLVPGWPGAETFPPQPMLRQTRYFLEQYQAAGGRFQETLMKGIGHSPFLEDQPGFLKHFEAFIQQF